LFQQFNEASKDSRIGAKNSAIEQLETCDLVVTDDDELENYLAHEDFQRFNSNNSRQSRYTNDQSVVTPTCGTGHSLQMEQTAIGNSIAQSESGNENLPAGKFSTQRRFRKGASAEVEMAQSIARSRLRDFNFRGGSSRLSAVFCRDRVGSVSDAGHQLFKTCNSSALPSTAASDQDLISCAETY
jgi:hypothetical protein